MFETEIIRHIQLLRSPFFDGLMKAVTVLGDEMFFLVVAVAVYWCVDKRFGFKLINVYLLGCMCVEGLKAAVARPRPYAHANIVSVGERTSGWSFPSGHSHSIANMSAQLSARYRKLYVLIPAIALCLVVAFSRLYLGQHYLSDVIVGLSLGVAFAFLFSYIFDLLGDREEYVAFVAVPVCFVVAITLGALGKGGATVMNVMGGYSAISIAYLLEKRFVKSELPQNRWLLLVRLVIGIGLLLLVKEGMKFILPKSVPLLYNFLRYFITAFTAAFAVPALFKAIKI